MNKTILVIEDDRRMNEIVCDYLEKEGFLVIKAYDGLEGLIQFNDHPVDLVILDIMMPKLDGWSVCRRIRQKSDALIIILSARSDEDDNLMGFEFGADEYVTKPFSPKVLVARVNALLKRVDLLTQNISNSYKPQINIKRGIITLDKAAYLVQVADMTINLTAKEFDLLTILMENEGNVYTREMLITNIWGYDYYGDGRVVDTNIKTLRKKLGIGAVNIVTVIGVGYKFEVQV